MSSPESLELALIMKKYDNWLLFTQLVQAYLIVSMYVWGLMDRYSGVDKLKMKFKFLELLTFCDVLHVIWHIRAIPTYRVYRLYDYYNYCL